MIPFVNLLPAHVEIRTSLDAAIERVRERGIFLNGPETELFEESFATYNGVSKCIACASGTDALSIAASYLLFGLTAEKDPHKPVGIQANTSPFTKFGIWERNPGRATSSPCVRTTIVDVDDRGWPMSFKNTIPVLLYGRIPADLGECPLIDACQAHGWKPTNRISCMSFYPSKNLGTFGDGGAILCREERDYDNLKKLVWPGEFHKMHSRMSEINAAVLRTKLPHLDRWNAERAAIAEVYYNELPDWAEPACRPGEPTNHHIFAVLVDRRDELEKHLMANGVGVKVHYREPLAELPGARRWCNRTLSLPIWPGLTAMQVREVCDTIRSFK